MTGVSRPGASDEMVREALQLSFHNDRAAVLATVARRVCDLHLAEDAVQDAFASAAQHWPKGGIPERPSAWLTTTAWRKALDAVRHDVRSAPQGSPELLAPSGWPAGAASTADFDPRQPVTAADDLLALVLLCAHPALDEAAQVALTLRHVAGLTDRQTAERLLVSPSAMTKRLVRARSKIKASRISFELPDADELPVRLDVARTVTYLLFTQGYSSGSLDPTVSTAQRRDAIWLGRQLHRLAPADRESTGLLALMLLHDARMAARIDANGELVPFSAHERSRYDMTAIGEARELLAETTRIPARLGTYQIQAAIAALHTTPEQPQDIDWRSIAALYEILSRIDPSPVVDVNRAVAIAHADGAEAALHVLTPLLADPRLSASVALHAAHAHLLAELGDAQAANDASARAVELAPHPAQRKYLARPKQY